MVRSQHFRICFAVTLAWAALATAASADDAPRPNVVLLIVDTLRADKLHCYGFSENTSPELDGLAEKGVWFANVFAQCSWTRPSVGSMLTSRYPRSLGLYKEQDEILADRFVTLAEVLREHGYRTVGITANPIINGVFNMHQGFDTYIDSNVVMPWMEAGGPEQTTRRKSKLPSAPAMFETVLSTLSAGTGPFFVQANLMEVHESWRGSKSLTRPEYEKRFKGHKNGDYLEAIRQVSADIGGFLERLAALPGGENTLVVITSDHGQGLADHPHVPFSTAHGRLLYESHLRVPLILHHLGGALPPREIERPVRLLDLMPTLLDYLGMPAPADVEGTSLLPLMQAEGATVDLPEGFIAETQYRKNNKLAVYAGEWKYIENRDGSRSLNPRELQRIGATEDGKRTDEIERHPEVAGRLRRYLAEWEARTPAEKPVAPSAVLSADAQAQIDSLGYLK